MLLNTRALALWLVLDVHDEGKVGVEVVVAVDMVLPRNILNIESTLGDTTNEALVLDLCHVLKVLSSLVREGINDDTEEDVQQNNVDKQEEAEVEDVALVVVVLGDDFLFKGFADTTTSSDTDVNR